MRRGGSLLAGLAIGVGLAGGCSGVEREFRDFKFDEDAAKILDTSAERNMKRYKTAMGHVFDSVNNESNDIKGSGEIVYQKVVSFSEALAALTAIEPYLDEVYKDIESDNKRRLAEKR